MSIQNIGIYAIANINSGKRYIGSTASSFVKRWNSHKSKLRNGKHRNLHLQAAWNKYGEESFTFDILEEIAAPEMVREREQWWLDQYFDTGQLYNHVRKAVLSAEEGREKMSSSQIIRFQSEESRQKISEGNKGKKHTQAAKEKISQAHLGRSLDDEHRAKLSEAKKGQNNHNFGKVTPESTRVKISEAQKGAPKSEIHREKLSAAKKGKPWSEARIAAQAARHTNKINLEQTS